MMDNEKLNKQLLNAALNEDLEGMRDALAKGANVNAKSNSSERGTALTAASWEGHVEVTEFLLDNGAKINEAKAKGLTPLILAAWNLRTDIVKLLVKRGANVNARSIGGITALSWALQSGSDPTINVEIVRILIENGADTSARDDDGISVLSEAIKLKKFEAAKLIAESGGLKGLKEELKEKLKRETNPAQRLRFKIRLTRRYEQILSEICKETKLGELKTIKPPRKEDRRWRITKRVLRN